MAKKRQGIVTSSRPQYILIEETYTFKDTVLERGKEIRIKNTRGTFTFYDYGKNTNTNKDWITCLHKTQGYFQSFRPEQIKEIVRPKVPRKKRVVNG